MTSLHLRRLIATAIFLAISLVLRITATGYIPLFGTNDVRVGIHGAFTILPAILFGPWYGAAASGLGDVLGVILDPLTTGALRWEMTLIAVLGGFARGWVWRLLRARSPVGTRAVVIAMTLIFLGFGSFSMIQLRRDGINHHFYDNVTEPSAVDTQGFSYIGRLVISRTQNTRQPHVYLPRRIAEVAYAPLGAGVLGVVLLGVDMLLSRGLQKGDASKSASGTGSFVAHEKMQKNQEKGRTFSGLYAPWNGSIMPLVLTVIIISLLVNTANSVLLWAIVMPGWRAFPFMYIWLPRAIFALLIGIVNVFIVALILKICKRQLHLKALME